MITRNKFNERHAKKGGVNKLVEMIENCSRRAEIAKHFGVSEDRIRQWCVDMGLERPNYHRCMTVKEMIETVDSDGMEEVERRFKASRWYEEGLEAIRKLHAE